MADTVKVDYHMLEDLFCQRVPQATSGEQGTCSTDGPKKQAPKEVSNLYHARYWHVSSKRM